jgi:hypothetical protein
MANTPEMGLILDNYIGQSNPTGPGLWASHAETNKTTIDSHVHGPTGVINGSPIFQTLAYANGSNTIPAPTTTTPAFTLVFVTTSAGGATITLPLAAGYLNAAIIVMDTGSAGTHNITIARQGSDTIIGGISIGIAVNFGSLRFAAQGAGLWNTF